MNPLVRHRLCMLIAQQGASLAFDSGRCEALLRDHFGPLQDVCGSLAAERNLLILAARHAIPQAILATPRPPWPALRGRLLKQLQDDHCLETAAALWAIETWALALGVLGPVAIPTSGPSARGAGFSLTHDADLLLPSSNKPPLVVSRIGADVYRAIGDALRQASPGDTIHVHPGLYDEALVIDKDVNIVGQGSACDIVVAPSESGNCVSMATQFAVLRNLTLRRRAIGGGQQANAVQVPQGRLVLHNCCIEANASAAVVVANRFTSCHIRNVAIKQSTWGVWVTDQADVLCERSTISGCVNAAIEVLKEALCTVRSCDVQDGRSVGVVASDSGRLVCEGARVQGNHGYGLWIKSAERNEVLGCEISRNGKAGVRLEGGAQARICESHITRNGDQESSQVEVHHGKVELHGTVISEGGAHGVYVGTQGHASIETCTVQRHRAECLHVSSESTVSCERSTFLESESFCVSVMEKSTATFSHCEIGISKSVSAVLAEDQSAVTLAHCQVHHAEEAGVYVCARSKAVVHASTLSDCKHEGVASEEGSKVEVRDCTLTNNVAAAFSFGGSSVGSVSGNRIIGAHAFSVSRDSTLVRVGNSLNGSLFVQVQCKHCQMATEVDGVGEYLCPNGQCSKRFVVDENGNVCSHDLDTALVDVGDGEDEEDESAGPEGQDGEDDDLPHEGDEFDPPLELICDECGEEWEVSEACITVCPARHCLARYEVDADGDVLRIEDADPNDDEPELELDCDEGEWEDADEEEDYEDDE